MTGSENGSSRHSLAVLGACLLWGTTGTVASFAPAGSSAAVIGLSTFGFGALALLAFDVRGVLRLLRGGGRTLAWLVAGALGVVVYAICFYSGMAKAGVAVGNVIALGAGPVFAAILELALDRTSVTRRWLVATALAVLGIVMLAVLGGAHEGGGGNPVLGVLLALAAAFGYALYSFVGARLIRDGLPSRHVMASIFTLAAVVALPLFAISGPGPLLSGRGLLILAYLALGPMALAYLLFGYGLRGLRASSATTLALTEPVVATLLAVAVVGERLSLYAWCGMALVLAAVVLLALPGRGQRSH